MTPGRMTFKVTTLRTNRADLSGMRRAQKTRLDNELFHWLALALIPGVGSARFSLLLDHFKTPRAVFQASAKELAAVPRLPRKTIEALVHFDGDDEVRAELERVQSLGVELITLEDPAYPPRLKQISSPPPVLRQ